MSIYLGTSVLCTKTLEIDKYADLSSQILTVEMPESDNIIFTVDTPRYGICSIDDERNERSPSLSDIGSIEVLDTFDINETVSYYNHKIIDWSSAEGHRSIHSSFQIRLNNINKNYIPENNNDRIRVRFKGTVVMPIIGETAYRYEAVDIYLTVRSRLNDNFNLILDPNGGVFSDDVVTSYSESSGTTLSSDDKVEDVYLPSLLPAGSSETRYITPPEGMSGIECWECDAPYRSITNGSVFAAETIDVPMDRDSSSMKAIRVYRPKWIPAKENFMKAVIVTSGIGAIDLGSIQKINETYTSQLTTIPIQPYGFKGTFGMDAGVKKTVTLTIERQAPDEPNDSSPYSNNWSNRKWISKLREVANRWQMLNDGSRFYLLTPTGDNEQSYTDINGDNCYLSTVSFQFNNTSPKKITASIPIVFGTTHPKAPKPVMKNVIFLPGGNRSGSEYSSITRKNVADSTLYLPTYLWQSVDSEDDSYFQKWYYAYAQNEPASYSLEAFPGDTIKMPSSTSADDLYVCGKIHSISEEDPIDTNHCWLIEYDDFTSNDYDTISIVRDSNTDNQTVFITMISGGGGGGSTNNVTLVDSFSTNKFSWSGGGGGGASGKSRTDTYGNISASSTCVLTDVSIGAGGAGGTYDFSLDDDGFCKGGNDGSDGGTTQYTYDGSTVSVTGGKGGKKAAARETDAFKAIYTGGAGGEGATNEGSNAGGQGSSFSHALSYSGGYYNEYNASQGSGPHYGEGGSKSHDRNVYRNTPRGYTTDIIIAGSGGGGGSVSSITVKDVGEYIRSIGGNGGTPYFNDSSSYNYNSLPTDGVHGGGGGGGYGSPAITTTYAEIRSGAINNGGAGGRGGGGCIIIAGSGIASVTCSKSSS